VAPAPVKVRVIVDRETITTDPPPARFSQGTAQRSVRKLPRRFTAIVRSHSSGASSSTGAHTPLMPAFATAMSSRP